MAIHLLQFRNDSPQSRSIKHLQGWGGVSLAPSIQENATSVHVILWKSNQIPSIGQGGIVFHGPWLVEVLALPYSWRRLPVLNALLNRDVFSLPHVGGSAARAHLSVCPKAATPSQGWCWGRGRSKVFLATSAALCTFPGKVIEEYYFSSPFPHLNTLPSPLVWAMAVQTAFRTTAPSKVWFHCKKTYSSPAVGPGRLKRTDKY